MECVYTIVMRIVGMIMLVFVTAIFEYSGIAVERNKYMFVCYLLEFGSDSDDDG